jgi:hypothetical protein
VVEGTTSRFSGEIKSMLDSRKGRPIVDER